MQQFDNFILLIHKLQCRPILYTNGAMVTEKYHLKQLQVKQLGEPNHPLGTVAPLSPYVATCLIVIRVM